MKEETKEFREYTNIKVFKMVKNYSVLESNETKVSLICTLKNEESSIVDFLNSLLTQSRSPDEIIIVDGGSTDKTVEIIKGYIQKKHAPIKLIVQKGCNIAEGRNLAIKSAKHDIIASTDAGCKIDKNWLKNIIMPFIMDPSIDVVSGWYEADAKTDFEKCAAEITYPKLEKVLENQDKFLPSSRSVAYKKALWRKVGGYPEWLYTAEDTLFDLNLKKTGSKFAFAKDAVVYWEVRPSLKSLLRQQFLYAKGDGEAKIQGRYYILLCFIYSIGLIVFLLGLLGYHPLLFLLILYVIYSLNSVIRYRTKYIQINLSKIINIVSLTLMIDMARLYGWFIGLSKERESHIEKAR